MFYDPILAKLIVWGENRNDAIQRMKMALENYIILGIKTQVPFLKQVIEHPEFINGNTQTDFLQKYFPNWQLEKPTESEIKIVLSAASIFRMQTQNVPIIQGDKKHIFPWTTVGNWEILTS